MNAALVCLFGLVGFFFAYRFYSRFLVTRVFGLDPAEPVPSRTKEDGVDYVPTDRHVLLGHHFASIAGAAPIIGPAIAVVWGWLPAVLWIVFGVIFMGGVHDLSTLVLSMRAGGQSIGGISAEVIGRRTRTLFLLVIFFLVFLIITVFAKAIAGLFVAKPATVVPINFQIFVAVAIGWVAYRTKIKLLWPSLAALVALYAFVWVGIEVPLSFSWLSHDDQILLWVVLLLLYSFVASVIPVWILLQPRDYINSHQLFVGLGALILGLFIASPQLTAPAVATAPADAPSLFPFLFVTIACGAISGFHGLVSSGTTSKQIGRATDARLIGYGAMIGEGVLALLATLAVAAGLGDWAGHYHSFAQASAGAVANFVEGAGSFISALGVARGPAEILVGVLVISFAATTLDTGVRIQRYILQELGEIYGIRALGDRYLAGAVAVILPFLLFISGRTSELWQLFGASNQLLAGLSLVVVTVYLFKRRSLWLVAGIPMLLVVAVSGLAMLVNLGRYIDRGQYVPAAVGALLLVLLAWVVLEGIAAMRAARREDAPAPSLSPPRGRRS